MNYKKIITFIIVISGIFIALPFFFTLAGDAQVHLSIAENFVRDFPFQYNPGGEIVVASTSPFWTILLITAYLVSGSWAPLWLKITIVLIWLATAFLLYKAARDLWRFSDWLVLVVLALWFTHTVVVANSLSGLENVLSAMQLLALYVITAVSSPIPSSKRSAAIGLLLGWMWLTRPDGGLFGLALLIYYGLIVILYNQQEQNRLSDALKRWLPHLALLTICAAVVLLPWYLYQGSVTGKFVTDSSLARLYSGRQGSIPIGPLFFHPKATISLATGFLPLAFGFVVSSIHLIWRFVRTPERRVFLIDTYAQATAVWLIIIGFIFYSFVVGAESFGRYFLPLYPFLFLTGVAGLALVFNWLQSKWKWAAWSFAALAILFFIAISSYDYYRRLIPGRFTPEQTVDVIYGPAHLQYYSSNLFDLIQAPSQRQANTDEFLNSLGTDEENVSIAVTEVQLRYFLDERVEVLSLDGRTSSDTLNYFNSQTGVPDFERYLYAKQPDYVHVNQWCTVGGWLSAIRPAIMEDNLICQWQQQTEQMSVGQYFTWDEHKIVLAAPEIVHIQWHD